MISMILSVLVCIMGFVFLGAFIGFVVVALADQVENKDSILQKIFTFAMKYPFVFSIIFLILSMVCWFVIRNS